ncbi:hypothetical protein AF79_01445 [Aliarcobacter butzleri L354]|uniref:hypothetical protein n=1 Tax=Aliarcobacter butzleri TaxID=28197 RepID=UPI00063AB4FE|nr:hypothetical protein [Aliarcobacter butzleri]KLE11277.1 hypothetical protein AF79_01445 [Aliarcobacter butzleri L354]
MIKNILNRNIQYNLLSLINVFIGFLFILYLGRKFGAGAETDIYFLSIVIIGYLGYFIQAIWEAMSPYYIEKKIKDKVLSDELYSILLNDLILISLIIIGIYFFFTTVFNILTLEQKNFIDIFIFYLIFQNILLFNKTILNLEHYYASFYLVDIFVYSVLFVTIFFFIDTQIIYIAYVTVIATFLANVWQFYLIYKKLSIKYSFLFYNQNLREIYKNSFKLKLGSLLYGSKDIIIASVFTSFGSGMFSLYSYANKFAGVIIQVVNAPIINIFSTKATYNITNLKYNLLKTDIKKVLSQTIILFILSGSIVYFILPYMLSLLFGEKFSKNDILTIQEIFIILMIFFLIWVAQTPYARILAISKKFNFLIFVDIVFIVFTSIFFLIFKFFLSYQIFLFGLCISQFVQFYFVYFIVNKYIFKLEILK